MILRIDPVGNIAGDIARELIKTGGADDLLNDAAQAAGFDGFDRMLSLARKGQKVLNWFTPDRVGLVVGLGTAGILAATRIARPGNAMLIGGGVGLAAFLIKIKT